MIPALIAAVPSLIDLFTKGGSIAEKAATAASTVAQALTGADNDDAALTALKNDPALMVKYIEQMNATAITLYQEESKRLESVNATMRAEYASTDPYVARWRPTFGYCMAATWSIQVVGTMAGILISTIFYPAEAPTIIEAIAGANAATVAMWGVALTVIGVSVAKRSDDKKTAAGIDTGPGVFGALARKVLG